MKVFKYIVMLLMVIGSLNWGLVGFFQYDLIGDLFGGMLSGFSRFIFGLIGLAGVWGISFLCHRCSNCGPNCGCGSKKR